MQRREIETTLREASEIVTSLPEHLQEKAFEIAVNLLTGEATTSKAKQVSLHRSNSNGERADTSDLIKIAEGNRDLYIIFLHEIEDAGESATVDVIKQRFSTYKKDLPGNISRDLGLLVASGHLKQEGSGKAFSWTLKEKARKRYETLVNSLGEA